MFDSAGRAQAFHEKKCPHGLGIYWAASCRSCISEELRAAHKEGVSSLLPALRASRALLVRVQEYFRGDRKGQHYDLVLHIANELAVPVPGEV